MIRFRLKLSIPLRHTVCRLKRCWTSCISGGCCTVRKSLVNSFQTLSFGFSAVGSRPANDGLRHLQETKCNFQMVLFRNRDRQFVFILFDVYGFSFFETKVFKPFPFEPDFGDRYHSVAAFLISGVDFKCSGIYHLSYNCMTDIGKAFKLSIFYMTNLSANKLTFGS